VFERADRIGGLMMYGIPAMKLDKGIVERRIKLLADEGVVFCANTEVGKNYPIEKLRQEFDAVALCGGSTVPRDLPVDGRQLAGVHFAMEFLTANTKHLLDGSKAAAGLISAKDKHVVVVGGGDTGTDCVGTSLRHGCKSLVQLELLPRPPSMRAADNPWPQWPKILRVDYGQEEATEIFGKDPRQFQMQTKRLLGDDKGHVRAIEVVEVRFAAQAGGPPKIEEVPGTLRVLPADLVLLAMGFLGPEKAGMLSELGVKFDGRGNVAVDGNKQTSVPGIFAAGDMARGQSLVVWAIAEGRDAAIGIDRYLMGETVLE
jgi:glutamate synthase (NADPH/NADH) small chain